MSDRAVEVVRASDARELLPRAAAERTSVVCRGGRKRRRLARRLRLARSLLEGRTMSDFTPSPGPGRAIPDIKDFDFRRRTGRMKAQMTDFGYAGCGKSTVLRFVLDELGLEPHRASVGRLHTRGVTATFTGKAALVLQDRARRPAPSTA